MVPGVPMTAGERATGRMGGAGCRFIPYRLTEVSPEDDPHLVIPAVVGQGDGAVG
jgi:hypothetical protein